MNEVFRCGCKTYISSLSIVNIILLLHLFLFCGSAIGDRSGKPSVFSLFNLKQRSKFWSEDVLHKDISNFEASLSSHAGKMRLYNFTSAGNLASYLRLSEIESLYIPVPLNFIFIGFRGEGSHDFKLGPEELERWFTKIDHIFEYTRIPHIGEILMPFYKMHVDQKDDYHLPLVSRISYNFSVHAIQMGEKVTSVLEQTIKVLARREDISGTRSNGSLLWQVDIHIMEHFFRSLLDYLELEDAYNIFILNPRLNRDISSYGYRRGFSESEINFLVKDKEFPSKLHQSELATNYFDGIGEHKKPLYAKHPMAKFVWTRAEDIDTVEWADFWLNALTSFEKQYQIDGSTDVIYNVANQILHGDNEDLKFPLEALRAGRQPSFLSECLTDTWIGNDRWAFIDLSAGPFSWGPSVGGEGVRTERSIPNVGLTVGAVSEISEEEAEDQLQDAIQEKFQAFDEGEHQAVDILLAEMDIYELFAFKNCKGRKTRLALCEELDERMRDLKDELKSFDSDVSDEQNRQKALDALKRMESWNLFSDKYEDFQNYTVARDSFLAHLGATLWGYMRHVVAPSVAGGAYYLYGKISFQLFFITQEAMSAKNLPVDLRSLMSVLSSLILPSQKVMFTPHMLALSEDPALAMAFSVARRAAAVPLLLANGTYRSTVRAYLDSSILQQQLRKLSDEQSPKGLNSDGRSTLEVPIFWFIYGESLLIDKYYQARNLRDMVIVAQSETSSWESHLQCNGGSLLLDLRRPIKAALAAVSEHLAGLIPLHLVYSHAHGTAAEDWIWSVGCNPHSITSHGWSISKFQEDTIVRSYIVTALEESIQHVNDAINRLSLELTTMQSFNPFTTHELELVNSYNAVISIWRRISLVSGELRFVDAANLLSSLYDSSKRFTKSVNATVAALHPIYCRKQRKIHIEFDMTTIPAFVFVIALLYFLLKPRRPKAKIN